MHEGISFGEWLKHRRKVLDLTQAPLARAVPCAVQTIRALEADTLRPSRELAARLAQALGLPAGDQAAFVGFARGLTDSQVVVFPQAPAGMPAHGPRLEGARNRRTRGAPSSSDQPNERAAFTAAWAEADPDQLDLSFLPVNTPITHPNNLPIQLTPLVGRAQAVAAVRDRLSDPQIRLMTLTGAGGIGKTRLALQVAAELRDHFPDGVWFVDLAPTGDPALVASSIADTLAVKEMAGQSTLESLKAYLRTKQLLCVLDNFEQVVAMATMLTDLLQAAPGLKLLVTSRVVLHLSGEHEYPVPPLALPDRAHLPPPQALQQYPAVDLFIRRTQAVMPDFQLTEANAAAVAEICVRLDGLPLAIELAAARSKLLVPQAMLARLGSRLKLLTGGVRDMPARQQTLRRAIDWSYSLLDVDEQTLFARLGVFVGGCTLEAAVAICNTRGDLPLDMLDGL